MDKKRQTVEYKYKHEIEQTTHRPEIQADHKHEKMHNFTRIGKGAVK